MPTSTSKLLFDNILPSWVSISPNSHFLWQHRHLLLISGAVVKTAPSQGVLMTTYNSLTQPKTSHWPQTKDNFQVQVHYHFQRRVLGDGQIPRKKVSQWQ